MKKILIQGGQRLRGSVAVAGSTTLALTAQIAALLASTGELKLANVADTLAVDTMNERLQKMNLSVTASKATHQLIIQSQAKLTADDLTAITSTKIASLMTGPLLVRTGRVRLNKDQVPDEVIAGLRCLGADISLNDETLVIKAGQLKGSHLKLADIDCLNTQSLILAAVFADGITVIENASCDFEVIALANLLNKMGARVHGAGTKIVRIQGVTFLHGCEYKIAGDYLEATALMLAAAITNGDVIVENVYPQSVQGVINQLERMGCTVVVQQNGVRVLGTAVLLPADPQSLFPSAMYSELAILQLLANGKSSNAAMDQRLLDQLLKMQASVQTAAGELILNGPAKLIGIKVKAFDAGSAMTLTLAGLAAKGLTIIENGAYLGDEFEALPAKLQSLGASLQAKDFKSA
ncbi:UDP-N-acetylglucosamine 1-carboxyvinyltransferase [Limosilactobacillus mucosae]|uniref:UDP-N-acetylglucosamine 1-carboxyvinyltransferase n=1 Tax=Limosilactobacillus mucosae TaxID=97478 RepID=UPI0039927B2A